MSVFRLSFFRSRLRSSARSLGDNLRRFTLVFTRVPDYVKIGSSGGEITIVVPRGSTSYHIKSTPSGGAYSAAVPTNNASRHSIQVDSGGGNISIAEAS